MKECKCSSNVPCDVVSGKCLCPPGFEGAKCEKRKRIIIN